MEKTYCKIVLVARMGAGIATPAFCAKRAFEKQGHTVFLFTPNMWPELFDEAGTFDATSLSRFFEVPASRLPDARRGHRRVRA